MASRKLIFLGAVLFALCAAPALSAGIPTQLTADVMDYDTETGDFKAQGHVTIKREDLTLTSAHGFANTQTQKARVWENVRAFGTYNGEKLDATCAQLDVDFAAPGGDYRMTGSVDATFGTRVLRSDTARLIGQTFSAENVRHFEDTARSMVLSCQTLDGDYDSQGLRYAKGKGSAHLVVTQKTADARVTDIRGDTLVYSAEKGTVTAEGNARAVQDGRRVSARTLIYHPDTGKLEAVGRPSITVDVDMSGALKNAPKRRSRSRSRRGGQ